MNPDYWQAFDEPFEKSVCDLTSVDGPDIIGDLLGRYGFSGGRGLVVDAGCGIGSFLKKHWWRFELAVGFDQVASFVSKARRRCREARNVLWVCDELESASKDLQGVFDLAVALNVLTSPSSICRKRQWKALTSMLGPGGKLLLALPSLESNNHVERICNGRRWDGVKRLSSGIVERRYGIRQQFYTQDGLRRLLTRQGLSPLEVRRAYYPWRYEGIYEAYLRGEERPWDWLCLALVPKLA